jgi:hypothetical protein
VVAKNQAVFREVNERIRELSERLRSDAPTDLVSFVCECSASDCHATVELTLAEYERVRSQPAQFVAAVDHLRHSNAEREVVRTSRYVVLEQVDAAAAEPAEREPAT